MFSFFGKRKKQKEFKEKRKGRRGGYTFLLALSIIVIFILLYFLIPASLVPAHTPTPIPSPTPAIPPPQPTSTNGTAIAVAALQTLQLQALCAPSQYISAWQVTNPNPYVVAFKYIAQSLGTSATATLTVPAANPTSPGVLKFQSYLERGGVIMRIFVADNLQAMAVANAEPCPTSPTPTQIPSYPFPDWAFLRPNNFGPGIPPNRVQIQATSFKPYQGDIATFGPDVVDTPKSLGISSTAADVPAGNGPDNWIFKGHELHIDPSDPTAPQKNFFHYINDTDKFKNGDDFKKMVDIGKRGIFFVDGDIDTDQLWPMGVTLIATGTIHVKASGNDKVGHAGPYAFSISFMAGGSKSGIPPSDPNTACAGGDPSSNWIAHFEVQQNGWTGIAYVPNGLLWIDTDYQSSTDPVGPIIAWSVVKSVSDGQSGNNVQFATRDASCFTRQPE
jgi:hypothetical protein